MTTTAVATPNTIRMDRVTLTPAMAQEWLDKGAKNRKYNHNNVNKYIRDLKNGTWRYNGETFTFKGDVGEGLNDGQHRCLAVVKSGIPIDVWACPFVDDEGQRTTDGGRKRSFSDQLKIMGVSYASNIQTVTNRAIAYERTGIPYGGGAGDPTLEESLDFYQNDPLIFKAARYAGSKDFKGFTLLPPGTVGSMMYVFSRKDEEDAEEFFNVLRKGSASPDDQPIVFLREKLIKEGNSNRKPNVTTVQAWMVKAFNAWRQGEIVKQIRFASGGTKKEKFPVVITMDGEA